MPSITMSIAEAFELALEHHRAGRLGQAKTIYIQILAQEPDDPDALQLLGLIAHDENQHGDAVYLIARAIAINPAVAEYHANLGVALWGAKRFDEAIAAYRAAIERDPNAADAHFNLGNALKDQGLYDEAVAAFRRALQLDPGLVDALVSLGGTFREQGLLDEAVAVYSNAIEIAPACAQAHSQLGFARSLQGQVDQALEHYRTAMALDPQSHAFQSQFLQTLHYHPGYDAAAIHQAHVCWSHQYAEPLKSFIRLHDRDRDPDRPLRIGYVSADFRNHACAFCLEHVMAAHDRQQFEIVCYAEVARPDDVTGRIQSHVSLWRDTVGLSDEQLADQIRADRVDILVDLKVHTAENRLLVFGASPRPCK